MAEILIEDRDCEACGTEVRKGALFCYHCGASVAPQIAVATDIEYEINGDVPDAEETDRETEETETLTEAESVEEFDALHDEESEKPEPETEETDESEEEEPKLKSAADLRRRSKRVKKKRVEIVWEEPERPPNVLFLVITLLLGGLALSLWLLARYLG